jgi:cardiolipin synthase
VPEPAGSSQVLTIPNLISFARLAGVPIFLWLVLGPHWDGIALVVLMLGGASDWVDGYLARRLNQVSRIGTLLDPIADRLYIFATILALTIREIVPWWFTALLLLREAVLLATLPVLRRHGSGPLPVHYVGKTATFILLFAFPALLLATFPSQHGWAYPVGWALAWWGLVLYWIAGGLYVAQTVAIVRAARSGRVGEVETA